MYRMRRKVGRRAPGLQVLDVGVLGLWISGTGTTGDVDVKTADVDLSEPDGWSEEAHHTRARIERADPNQWPHVRSAVIAEDQAGARGARTWQQRQLERL